MTFPNCLSEITFGSYLNYSPRGTSDVSVQSQDLTIALKNGKPEITRLVIERLRQKFMGALYGGMLRQVLGPDVTVIPCPRSTPIEEGWLWPASLICRRLVAEDMAREAIPILKRKIAVTKAATAGPGQRPKPKDHISSMFLEPPDLFHPERIAIVDDVITKGSTLLAAASHVKEAFPRSDVKVFAIMRTLGLIPEIDKLLDPTIGEIALVGDEAVRNP